jgi:hypothetical protein
MNGTRVERIAGMFVRRATVEAGQQADPELLRRHLRALVLDWWEETPGLTAGEAREVFTTARNEIARRTVAPPPALPLAA